MPNTKEEVIEDGDIQCVRYGEIYSKYDCAFVSALSKTNKEILSSPQYISYGDILFAGTGELVEEIGKNIVYLGTEPCLAGGDIVVKNVIPKHLEATSAKLVEVGCEVEEMDDPLMVELFGEGISYSKAPDVFVGLVDEIKRFV